MDPNQEIEDFEVIADEETDDSISVDDFIRELEAKEKDLHITAETTIIEIAEGFEDGELPEFLHQEFKAEQPKTKMIEPIGVDSTDTHKAKSTAKFEREISQLKNRIKELEAQRDEMLKDSNRRAKDYENFKTRTERERGDTFSNQVGNLATKMLPALDNLNRALDFALELPEEKGGEFRQFFDGIVLVNQQVNDIFAGMGIQPIAAVGKIFDPNLHEAVATEETDEFPPSTICAELRRGYRIGERVIRHSMVKVAKSTQEDDNDPVPEPEPENKAYDLETLEALAELDGDTDFDQPAVEVETNSSASEGTDAD